MSASLHTWSAAGRPAHPYTEEPATGVCATCAAPISSGVPLSEIETPTTSNHADFFRFGGRHVCPACAWLFAAGKGRPGNYVATPGRFEATVISMDSVVADKRPWMVVLPELAALPADTPLAGVMTTDVKPRLWPRVRLATVGHCGMYVHAPDYDVSEWREFSLPFVLEMIGIMVPVLTAGFSKDSLYFGLLRDHARAARDPARAFGWDALLAPHRGQPYFLPAMIAAGVTLEAKSHAKTTRRPEPEQRREQPAVAAVARNPEPAAAGGDRDDQAQLGLF